MDSNSDDFRSLPPGLQRQQQQQQQQQRQQVQDQTAQQVLARLHNGQLRMPNQRMQASHPNTLPGARERDFSLAILRDRVKYRQELEYRQSVTQRGQLLDFLASRQGNEHPPSALERQQALNFQNSGGMFLDEQQLRFQRAHRELKEQQDLLRQREMQVNNYLQGNGARGVRPSVDQQNSRRKRSSSNASSNINELLANSTGRSSSNAGSSMNDILTNSIEMNVAKKRKTQSLNSTDLNRKSSELSMLKDGKGNGVMGKHYEDTESTTTSVLNKALAEQSVDLTGDDTQLSSKHDEDVETITIDHDEISESPKKSKLETSYVDLSMLLKAASDPKSDIPVPSSREEEQPSTNGTNMDILVEASAGMPKKPDQAMDSTIVTFTDQEAFGIVQQLRDADAGEMGKKDEKVELFPGFVAVFPELPSEPEYKDDAANKKGSDENSGNELVSADTVPTETPTKPILLQPSKNKVEIKPAYYPTLVDTWWPSNSSIRREWRWQGYDSDIENQGSTVDHNGNNIDDPSFTVSSSMKDRLCNSYEPGVLEKLPHCKVHFARYQEQYGKKPSEPLFCFQVTEAYCNSTMVCCSICSTWRHAECGGHYKRYSTKSTEDNFTPICDRCWAERPILEKFPTAERRMKRQYTELVRRAQGTSAIMRQLAYAKHGGTYKWPLGSVSSTHIGGHTRSVHLRHERSEKQWGEMAKILSSQSSVRVRDKVKSRTKELERLAVNMEDAEAQTDRHNMILFLQNDTMKNTPVGFEKPLRNFFDPEEDERESIRGNANLSILPSLGNKGDSEKKEGKLDDPQAMPEEDSNTKTASMPSSPTSEDDQSYIRALDDDDDKDDDDDSTLSGSLAQSKKEAKDMEKKQEAKKKQEISGINNKYVCRPVPTCAKPGCSRRPRMDSAFCSDGCGVSALELDVLRSLQYANEIHPYQLRL